MGRLSVISAFAFAGPLKKELQRQVRRNPNLTYAELFQEAKELEKEGWGEECESHSHQVTTVPPVDDLTKWKEDTRTELIKLVTELKNVFKEELENSRPAPRLAEGAFEHGRPRRPLARPRWDEQGRPICLHCEQPGHLRRNCPQRQLPLNGQSRPL
ncbi:uncharacterized protein V6R79_010895 [Siganus canaliculatus]